MNSILFVDDEPAILEGMRNALRRKRTIWNMVFADSGAEAIRLMAENSFTGLVTDLRMPGVDGIEVLHQAAKLRPQMIRIVLSGQADRDSILQVLPFSHHFLSKPCPAEELEQLLERAIALQEKIGSDEVHRMTGSVLSLQPIGGRFSKLSQLLQNPDSTLEEVAAIIQDDPTVAARMLQLANSAYFGFTREISAISEAVALLGFDIVRSVVLSSSLFAMSNSLGNRSDFTWLAARSHRAAVLAARFSSNKSASSQAFSAALLMDIGIPVLANAEPEKYRRVLERSLKLGLPLFQLESAAFGTNHAEVGAHLLGMWGLPLTIVEAVANHHSPTRIHQMSREVTAATHIAAALVESLNGADGVRQMLDLEFLSNNDLAEQSERWIAESLVA